MKKRVFSCFALACLLGISGCGGSDANDASKDVKEVKVGVVGEYNDQWDKINELLEPEGIKVTLVKFSDYAMPNNALAKGDIDMNAFQHKAFLENDIKVNGYDITSIGDTIIAPLSIFNNKDKIQSIEDLKDGDVVAIPSDATNGGRALKLLEAAGIIECDPSKGYVPTKFDITKKNVDIEIMELESAMLAAQLPDVTAAIINGGNAYTAGLNPNDDAIYTEDVNPETNSYVDQLINVIAVRSEDKDNEVYKKVVEAYQSDECAKVIEEAYQGAFKIAW